VREILANHQPRELDPVLEQELDAYRQMVAQREIDEFFAFEAEDKQDVASW
jgi:hypothetical protein